MTPLIARLDDTAIIAVTGKDSEAFLQAQLSQDVSGVGADRWKLAGWHDPRGRVRCLLRLWRTDNGFLASTAADIAAETVTALQRYVLRADVQFEVDLRYHTAAIGLPAENPSESHAAAQAGELYLPGTDQRLELTDMPGHVARFGSGHILTIAPSLWHLHVTNEDWTAAQRNAAESTRNVEELLNSIEIRAGIPIVNAHSTGAYVAQMLNLDLLNAISFTKGCYPGQEIIARAEHLGSVKRRLRAYTVSTSNPPAAGTNVVNEQSEIVGAINRAAIETDSVCALLAVMRTDVDESRLFLNSPNGPLLTRFSLPYE